MKKSFKNTVTLLVAVTVCGLFLFGQSLNQPVPAKKTESSVSKAEPKPWDCPEKVTKLTNPIQPQEAILETGKEIWNTQCKSCHGKYGKGDGVKATKIDIPVTDFTSEKCQTASDGELFWKATEGRKPMPSFKYELSDIERWSVVMYLRTFASN